MIDYCAILFAMRGLCFGTANGSRSAPRNCQIAYIPENIEYFSMLV
jgi:hypothetical protein